MDTVSELSGSAPFRRSMVNDLAMLRAFVAVVDCGSFSEAGGRLGVVPSTVSKYVATLEERLACQLIVRSTKRLSVTEPGEFFYRQCAEILGEAASFELEMVRRHVQPRGTLKLLADAVFAQHHLTPLLMDFLAAYPGVKLELLVTTGIPDRRDAEYDVAILIGDDIDPGLTASALAPNIATFCASPAYLARAGTPQTIADLRDHDCLYPRTNGPDRWSLGDHALATAIGGSIIVDNHDFLRCATLDGAGIARIPRFMVQADIDAGTLIELFPDRRTTDGYIHVGQPAHKPISPVGQAFIEHIRDVFLDPPAWAV